jgi:hypothetical protein
MCFGLLLLRLEVHRLYTYIYINTTIENPCLIVSFFTLFILRGGVIFAVSGLHGLHVLRMSLRRRGRSRHKGRSFLSSSGHQPTIGQEKVSSLIS